MGNYNSQYESYYAKIAGKKNYNGYNSGSSYRYNYDKNSGGLLQGYFAKRFVNELIGVLCLILLVFMCKLVKVPETKMIYEYTKNMVNQDFEYEKLLEKVKNTKYTDVQLYVENLIGNMRIGESKIY